METTVTSVGKSVLVGALDYARSKATEEVALHLGVEDDVAFIADELEMMQSFLMTADEERRKQNVRDQPKVRDTWVKHVRDLAYNVEDSLMDFSLLSEKKKSWWRCPRTMVERRRIAVEMKKLRAKVEVVSSRNLRYCLINKSSGSNPAVAEEQASVATMAMFGINEARFAPMEHGKSSEVDLHQLITSNDVNLRVIALWGTNGDLGKISAIEKVYNDPMVLKRFRFCAWIRLMHPFNPQEFLRSLVRQFYENTYDKFGKAEQETSVGVNVLAMMEKMNQNDLIRVFNEQLCRNSYLIVIDNLSTIVDWHCIKKYFPDNKKQSRIIVSSQQVEIARLCTEKPHQVSEFKQLSCDQTIYLFHGKNSDEQFGMASVSVGMPDTKKATFAAVEKEKLKPSCSAEPVSDSNFVTTSEKNTGMLTSEIQEEDREPSNAGEEKVNNSIARKKFNRSRTLVLANEVLYGRETEKSTIINLVGQPDNNQGRKVVSVWGMGGLGKTTFVRSIYRSQQLGGWKRAWASVLRPFNREVLLRDLALQLQDTIQEDHVGSTATGAQKKNISAMKLQELEGKLVRVLQLKSCLVVLDDISSTSDWELIKSCLDNAGMIIVTTRDKKVAEHCSGDKENMHHLERLNDDAAFDLFIKKVFKDSPEKYDLVPAMMEQARLTLQKCDGLPIAISTIGGFLGSKPKTAIEWRKMNDCIRTELEINPELRPIKTILMSSYDGLPYHLKSAFLYMSIFPKDHKINWGRLVTRWIAEGYSRDMDGMTAVEHCQRYFDELLDRSMILAEEGIGQYKPKISCQLHDMMREICISEAMKENLVFTLKEGCCLSNTQGAIRHLVIGSNWKRDKDVLESILDLTHIRSLTVFGEWRPFFISNDMRFLRVLDLEDTLGLMDHHLDKIGQLHHLKYLSLRGCRNIVCLPTSLWNLRQLQTLDARDTSISELPTKIRNLQKLQHLRARGYWKEGHNVKEENDIVVKYRSHCTCQTSRVLSRVDLLMRPHVLDAGLNRRDICNLHRFVKFDARRLNGVVLRGGIGKLKALQTLDVVEVSRSNGKTLKELGLLTQLRKLRVCGISHEDIKEFWSAIAGHSQLRSLTVRMDNEGNQLDDCLGGDLVPPRKLESLTLYGKLVRITEWIRKLENLSKLVLLRSKLEQGNIEALGSLPDLAVLRLDRGSFLGNELPFQRSSFPSLMVLELFGLDLRSVSFEEEAMPKLELLQVGYMFTEEAELSPFFGLPALTSLKEIRLRSDVSENVKNKVRSQAAKHLKHVRVNIT